jgi:pyruvate dehydrogenase (quinone)
MSMTSADYIARVLELAGIEHIYGVAGGSLDDLTDALRRLQTVEWIPMRREESAAFAAGAEAHLTGQLAVCAGTCGPGNLHLVNGLYDCHRNGVPVLAIAAHVTSSELGTDYFQATQPESLFKECSHYVELVSNPTHLPRILGRAMRAAVARRGVAVVVVPADIALIEAFEPVPRWITPARPIVHPSIRELRQLTYLLRDQARVTMLCGAGCAGAREMVLELARRLKSPIAHTLRGKEFIEYDNPYDVGMAGVVGFSSGHAAMKDCDVLLLLGTDFPYRQFYPEHAKIVQIDIRPEALGNRCPIELGLVGDVRETLQSLLPSVSEKMDTRHLDSALKHYRQAHEGLHQSAMPTDGTGIIHPREVTRLVSELASEDAIFACDAGTQVACTARYLKMNGKRRIVGSFNHGSMANGMLQAIGAQVAYPGRQVVSLSGDGGFAMMMGELLSLVQLRLPVKIVLMNDGTLGSEPANPDFTAMANAIGVKGIRVEVSGELRTALTDAFEHDGPVLVDVVRRGGDQLVDLPKVNLLR